MANGSDVIILSEHWLWPFEMHKLKEISPEFDAECVTDSRLNETSSLTRGCGGVGILWKKSFDVTPIGEIHVDSDRICGIRMRLTYISGDKRANYSRSAFPLCGCWNRKVCTSTL